MPKLKKTNISFQYILSNLSGYFCSVHFCAVQPPYALATTCFVWQKVCWESFCMRLDFSWSFVEQQIYISNYCKIDLMHYSFISNSSKLVFLNCEYGIQTESF